MEYFRVDLSGHLDHQARIGKVAESLAKAMWGVRRASFLPSGRKLPMSRLARRFELAARERHAFILLDPGEFAWLQEALDEAHWPPGPLDAWDEIAIEAALSARREDLPTTALKEGDHPV